MKRRGFVGTAGLGVLATGALLGSPALHAQTAHVWKMVSAFPENIVSGRNAARIAKTIETLSNKRIKVSVQYPGPSLKAFDCLDAVSKGSADLALGINYYWMKKDASHCFSAVPFGLGFAEMVAWLNHGGGQALWDELYAPYNVKPFPGGNSGAQMGGWFNREIKTMEDFKGLKMRIGGLGKKVLDKAGAQALIVPANEVISALGTGKVDAAEWSHPYEDALLGLHKVAKYYYWPGWHEPEALLELLVNKKLYDALPRDLQEVIRHAALSCYLTQVAEYIYLNGDALVNLLKNYNVQLRHFPSKVLQGLAVLTKEVLQDIAAQDPFSKRIIDSYVAFRGRAVGWSQIGEEGASQARSQVFSLL